MKLSIGNNTRGVPVQWRRAVAAPAAAISAVAANGSFATMLAPSELSMAPVSLSRAGFDSTGAAVTHLKTLYCTKRQRQVYPDHALLTAASVALSDPVYASDSIAGVTNNSTLASPKPVAEWIMEDRATVGNSLAWELLAWHLDGIACVEVRATDGTNTTAWQRVSTPAVSTRGCDHGAVIAFAGTLDISALANLATVTLERRVTPRIGLAASILGAGDASSPHTPATRKFWKDTTLAGAPLYAYVAKAADAGNGIGTPSASGVVSSNLATAKATPFDTQNNALTGLNTNRGSAGVDGCIIMLGADGGAPHLFGAAGGTRNQRCGALVITRDPNVSRANARLQWGTGSAVARPRLGGVLESGIATAALHARDLRVVRSDTLASIQGESAAGLELAFIDCEFDNGGLTSDYRSTNVAVTSFFGLTIENAAADVFAAKSAFTRINRGVELVTSAAGVKFDRQQLIGCRLSGVEGITKVSSRNDDSGLIITGNHFLKLPGTGGVFLLIAEEGTPGAVFTSTGIAVLQNAFETTGVGVNSNALVVSADGDMMSIHHMMLWHNSFAGFDEYGRRNAFYDESSGTYRRTFSLVSDKGNIYVRSGIKGDLFVGDNQARPSEAPFRTGNQALLHGVGVEANLHQWRSDFPYDYYGRGSVVAASTGTRTNPLFVSDQAASAGPTAGAGGSNLALGSGSPAIGLLSAELLSHDLAGNARDRLSAGAYR